MTRFVSRTWRRMQRRVGRSGLAGIGLLAIAALMAEFAPQLYEDAARIDRSRNERARALPVQPPAPPPVDRSSPSQLVARLPSAQQNAADLKKLFEAARRNGVSLPRGDYQFASEPNSPFVGYTATFPVSEGYGAIKRFVADALRELPHAAMDDLRLERPDAGAAVVEARIRITLYYRAS
jgi:hypothetical protein